MHVHSHGRSRAPLTAPAKPLTLQAARAVTRLARAVIAAGQGARYRWCMTDIDRQFAEQHRQVHDQPLAHVRVHVAWMHSHLARKNYARAAFHAFAGYVLAVPASLVQRTTGLAVPAFKARS